MTPLSVRPVGFPALAVALALGGAACANPLSRHPVRRALPASEGFTTLEVDDLDVVVRLGYSHQVSLRCDPERLPYARVTVRGDVLRAEMRDEPPQIFGLGDRPCVAEIYMPALRAVRIEGSGDVRVIGAAQGLESVALEGSGDARFDDAEGDDARFELSGSGDLRVRRLEARRAQFSLTGSGDVEVHEGAVFDARLTCTGSGDVSAARLVTETAEVHTTGSGGVRVTARQRARVDVSGSGDVLVTGGPAECEARSSGSGDAVCR
jgi:hypothetical protein